MSTQQQARPHGKSRTPDWPIDRYYGVGYDGQVMADEPIGFWKLNETAGTVARDSSGCGRHGTYVGTPTLGVAGQIDKAVQLNGTSQYITIDNIVGLPNTGAYTFDAIIQRVGNGTILSWGVGSTRNTLIWRISSATAILQAWWFDDYSQTVTSLGTTWHHVAAVYTGSVRRTYVDGVQVGTDNTPGGTPNFFMTNSQIGHDVPNNTYFSGKLQRVAIYNYALSSARILAHKVAAFGP